MANRERILEDLIVLRCQLGQVEAYRDLVDMMQDRLLYYLRRLLSDEALVYDVMQEVWLTVFRRLTRLRKVESFRPWIYRIAHDKAVSHIRAKVSRDRAEATYVEDKQTDEDDGAWNWADASMIHALLQKLRLEHREVLTLFFLEDMKYEEIANVIGCSVGTVKSRIFYAKTAMRSLMEGSGDERT